MDQLQNQKDQVLEEQKKLEEAEVDLARQREKLAEAKQNVMDTDDSLTIQSIDRELKAMQPPLAKPSRVEDGGQAWRRECINELDAQLQVEQRELEQLMAETSDVTAAMEQDYERVSLEHFVGALLVHHNVQTMGEQERQSRNFESKKAQIQNQKAKCDELKEKWLPELKERVKKVSANLSNYFGRIECDGEVSIGIPEDPEHYSKYELHIRVRFRKGMPLKELAVGRQELGVNSTFKYLKT